MRNRNNKEEILQAAEAYAKEQLGNDTSGHDFWHVKRVVNLALQIAKEEKADLFICHLAALLHDVADGKLNSSEEAGLAKVEHWLLQKELEPADCQEIMAIISHISFKGGQVSNFPLSTEGKIVQDADRLDALGAIGIARAMVYSGYTGRTIHIPGKEPRQEMTLEEYRSTEGTAIMHFYEKLLTLKDKMNTETAKKLAEGRHAFMENYLEQFYAEWEGER